MHKSRVVLGCIALALALALLIPLVGCGGVPGATPTATPIPTITATATSTVPSCTISSPAGTVQVQKKGSTAWTNATAGMKLQVGDSLKTGSDGSAVLFFFDGSSMEVKANSQILVNTLSIAGTGSTTVGLRELVGSTVNRVAKLVDSSSKYEVDTPAAVAVVRGTVFDLLVQPNGDTTVKVQEDSVLFTASGVTLTVNQGFQSSASVGGTPSTPSASSTATPTPTPLTAPTVTAAATSTDGTIITVTFSKAMNDPSDYAADFSFTDNGTSGTFSDAALESDNTKIDLTLSGTPIANGDTVTVSYSGTDVTATDGGVLQGFSSNPVTNNVPTTTPTPAPTVTAAATSTDGTIITITFSEAMNDPSDYAADFSFTDNGTSGTFSDAALESDNTKIDLTLSGTPIANGDTVTVSYSGTDVTATDGGVLQGFSSNPVTNNVPTPTTTPTPTETSVPTNTPTATATPTSTSGSTLADIWGGGKNLRDVEFDMVMTSPSMPQGMNATMYYQNFGTTAWKSRTEMSEAGSTLVTLVDYGAQTAYEWTEGANTAYELNWSQVSNPTANATQIYPTYIGTDTVDGYSCDVWQWTVQTEGTTATVEAWIWTAKSFPIQMEITTSGVTTTMEYQNIVFGPLDPSLFQLPAGVTVTQLPS